MHKLPEASWSTISADWKRSVLMPCRQALFSIRTNSEEDGKRTPPEQEKVYPEPWMFGTIPAKGFYIRHAKNITFDGVRFHFAQPDGRPLFVTDDAENIEYYHTPQE